MTHVDLTSVDSIHKKTASLKKMNTFLWRSTKTANTFTFSTLAHARKYLGKNGPTFCLESYDFDHKFKKVAEKGNVERINS
jgi:hypothetical protein